MQQWRADCRLYVLQLTCCASVGFSSLFVVPEEWADNLLLLVDLLA